VGATRVYRVLLDGEQVGDIWLGRPLYLYLRLLRAGYPDCAIRVQEAHVAEWHDTPLVLFDDRYGEDLEVAGAHLGRELCADGGEPAAERG
jgi:hypothetical protein